MNFTWLSFLLPATNKRPRGGKWSIRNHPSTECTSLFVDPCGAVGLCLVSLCIDKAWSTHQSHLRNAAHEETCVRLKSRNATGSRSCPLCCVIIKRHYFSDYPHSHHHTHHLSRAKYMHSNNPTTPNTHSTTYAPTIIHTRDSLTYNLTSSALGPRVHPPPNSRVA